MKPSVTASHQSTLREKLFKILLGCGIFSSLLYVSTDLFAANQWTNYQYCSQSVSELEAIDAPTRPVLLFFFTFYSLLVVLFGSLIRKLFKHRPGIRTTGALLVIYGIIGEVTLLFFPIHLRGKGMTATDTMHIVLTGANVLCMLMVITLGATADARIFRYYSYLTLLILIVFGILTGLDGRLIASGQPTPWVGVKERINIYGYMLWMGVLAFVLFGARDRLAPR
jgi:hypothetical protein